MIKQASDARKNRKAAAQRLIDQSAQETGKVAIVTGIHKRNGKIFTVKLRPQSLPKVATT